MKLIVITTEDFWDGEAETLNALFDCGLETLHLRKPTATADEVAALLSQIDARYYPRIALHQHYDLLSRFPRLKGIHLKSRLDISDSIVSNNAIGTCGQDCFVPRNDGSIVTASLEVKPSLTTSEVKPSLTTSGQVETGQIASLQERLSVTEPIGATPHPVSRSCHTLEEVRQSEGFEYVFLSPIFDSISKQGYRAGFTREELLKARDEGIINERVIALGGVTAERLPEIKTLGFGGAAVIGAVWNVESGQHRHCERSEAIPSPHRHCERSEAIPSSVDCFVPRNDENAERGDCFVPRNDEASGQIASLEERLSVTGNFKKLKQLCDEL